MTYDDIQRMNYFDCYIASLKLKELAKINDKPFYCGENIYKLKVVTSCLPYVKIMKRKNGNKNFTCYSCIEILEEKFTTILDIVSAVVRELSDDGIHLKYITITHTIGMEPLTVEQLAHYLES